MVIKGHLLSHEWLFVERAPEKVYVPNVLAIKQSFLMHKYCLHHWLIRCLLNWLEWVDLIWCDSDQRESSRNVCDSKLQNFCTQLFQFQNYLCAQHFEFLFPSIVFTFTILCATTRKFPGRKILHTDNGIKHVAVTHTVWIWYRGYDWSLWVYPSEVINSLPGYWNTSTTLKTNDGEVFLITVS